MPICIYLTVELEALRLVLVHFINTSSRIGRYTADTII